MTGTIVQEPFLTAEESSELLRHGSLALLSEVTGFKSSQFSAWFARKREISDAGYQRLSEALNLEVKDVRRIVGLRRQEQLRKAEVESRIRQTLSRQR